MNEYQKRNSKYLKKPEDKKSSAYIKSKDDQGKKSKYFRDANEKKEHHYNLARNYRDGVLISELEEEQEALEQLDEAAIEAAKEAAMASDEQTPAAKADKIVKEIVEEINADDEAAEEIAEIADADISFDNSDDIVSASEQADVQATDEQEEAPAENDAEAKPESADAEKQSQTKGDITSLFEHSKMSKETAVAHVENQEEQKYKMIVSMIVTMVVLTAIASLLQFAGIKLPYVPSMLSVELSAFPELIVSLAYGPVFGVIVVIVKNLIHIFIEPRNYVSIISNLVLDSAFVISAGLFYSRRMFAINTKKTLKPKKTDMRRKRIFLGGFFGTVITTVISFFLTRYVSYPLIIKQFSGSGIDEYSILNNYQVALDSLNHALPEKISGTITQIETLTQAIIYYNIPILFFKYLFITVVCAVVYIIISPYLHFRKRSKH